MKKLKTKKGMKILADLFPSVVASWVIFIRIATWLESIHFNEIIVSLTSFFALVYLVMKMYDQYQVTKERKKENERKKNELQI